MTELDKMHQELEGFKTIGMEIKKAVSGYQQGMSLAMCNLTLTQYWDPINQKWIVRFINHRYLDGLDNNFNRFKK